MRRAALLLLALAVGACGPLSPPKPDGGLGGGGGATGGGGGATGGGGGATGGGGGATGGGGGATGGGGGATGGGGGATGGGAGGGGGDGPPVPRQFSSVIVSTSTTPVGPVKGFAEVDGAVWAVTQRGHVLKSTGGEFSQQTQLLVGGSPVYVQDFSATPDGAFFVLTTVRLLVCPGACDQPGNWTTHTISPSDEVLESVCGHAASDVLAVGARGGGNTGIAYRWNGSGFSKVSNDLGMDSPRGCWRNAAGELVFGGVDAVVRYAGGGFNPEPATLADAGVSQQRWRAGAVVGGFEVLAGPGKRIARKLPTGLELVLDSRTAGELRAVVAPGASEAWAFGGGPTADGTNAYEWNGQAWTERVPRLPGLYLAHAAAVTDGGVVYVGGEDDNAGPVILRGTR